MKEAYHKWQSPILGEEAELLVFGYGGRPLILFPTSMGRYYEAKDRGLIGSVSWFIENGDLTIYCPSNIDARSWYNKDIPPAARAVNHNLYDRFIDQEVLPRALSETGWQTVSLGGCSFGGYHAANFAFKHPEKVNSLISMSGIFDIRSYVDGYYDDMIYFNNPMDFLPKDNRPQLWQLRIILGTTDSDICLEQNKQFSGILQQKDMHHWLDIRENRSHDWPVWREMFPHYISTL